MARNHARIFTAIWRDPDFRRLDQNAQHAYFAFVSQERLSYCGVLDYIPGRFADLTAGWTEPKVRAAVKTLERHRFVVVDRKTHELLVRSYVRHDGVMKRRNMGNAVAKALGVVASTPLRDVVLHELARLRSEDPAADGWSGFRDFDPMAFDMTCAMAFDMASGEA